MNFLDIVSKSPQTKIPFNSLEFTGLKITRSFQPDVTVDFYGRSVDVLFRLDFFKPSYMST